MKSWRQQKPGEKLFFLLHRVSYVRRFAFTARVYACAGLYVHGRSCAFLHGHVSLWVHSRTHILCGQGKTFRVQLPLRCSTWQLAIFHNISTALCLFLPLNTFGSLGSHRADPWQQLETGSVSSSPHWLPPSFTLSCLLLLPSPYLSLIQLNPLPSSFLANNHTHPFIPLLFLHPFLFQSEMLGPLVTREAKDGKQQSTTRQQHSKKNNQKTNLPNATWPHITSCYSPITSGQFEEWLNLWLIHSTAAGECSSNAPEHPNNLNLSHYSQPDLWKSLCICGCWNIFEMYAHACVILLMWFCVSVLSPKN